MFVELGDAIVRPVRSGDAEPRNALVAAVHALLAGNRAAPGSAMQSRNVGTDPEQLLVIDPGFPAD